MWHVLFPGFLSLFYKPQEVLCVRDYQKFPSIEAALTCIVIMFPDDMTTVSTLLSRSFCSFEVLEVIYLFSRRVRNKIYCKDVPVAFPSSVYPHITTFKSLNRFPLNFIRYFTEIYVHSPTLVKI